MGGGDDPHIHFDGLARTDAGNFPLLQHAQQLDLQRQAQFADLIEQQGPALGGFKPAGVALHRAGKGAFFMAEEFSFRQAFGQRAAVNGEKRLVATRAVMMKIAGNHLFTGAGFADDQDGGFRWRQLVQQALKRFRRRVDEHGRIGQGFRIEHGGPPLNDALNLSSAGDRHQRGTPPVCCKCVSAHAGADAFATAWMSAVFFN